MMVIKKNSEPNLSDYEKVKASFSWQALAEGEFHEAMNLASLWKVPVLLVCENNLYAMGTAPKYSQAMTEFEKKRAAYGMESAAVDGMDLMKVIEAANPATQKTRSTGKPFLLVCNTHRFWAHLMFDAELYREKAEIDEWKKNDPIAKFQQWLMQQGWITEPQIRAFESKIENKIQMVLAFAEAGTCEPIDQLPNLFIAKPESKIIKYGKQTILSKLWHAT